MAVIGSSSGGRNSKGVQLIFGSSTSYSPPYKCKVLVHAIGGGGSGGVAGPQPATNHSGTAAGGGAGAYCGSVFTLDPSVTYVITIASGGATVSTSGINTAFNGNTGGTTSFSGTGILTLNALGGSGGAAAVGVTSGTTAVTGGAGGVATSSGNIINISGGAGGSASIENTGGSGSGAAGGGGGVGIFGTAYDGGGATLSTTSGSARAGGGGAGVGGAGESVTASLVYGAGGTTLGADPTTRVHIARPVTSAGLYGVVQDGLWSQMLGRYYNGVGEPTGIGFGSAARASYAFVPGWFGGSGAELATSATSTNASIRAAGIGGGSGGTAGSTPWNGPLLTSRAGGTGLVIIDVLEQII